MPAIPAIIILVLSPSAGLPHRLLPSISISNEAPAVNSQLGCTLKVNLRLRLSTSTRSVIAPGKLLLGRIADKS